MIETVCKILLSIVTGVLLTGLLIVGVTLVLCCVGYVTGIIQACVAKIRYIKYWYQICFDIIAVISLLVTISLISAYMYFQL